MTKAAIDGEAGLCANKAVGTGALTIDAKRQNPHKYGILLVTK